MSTTEEEEDNDEDDDSSPLFFLSSEEADALAVRPDDEGAVAAAPLSWLCVDDVDSEASVGRDEEALIFKPREGAEAATGAAIESAPVEVKTEVAPSVAAAPSAFTSITIVYGSFLDFFFSPLMPLEDLESTEEGDATDNGDPTTGEEEEDEEASVEVAVTAAVGGVEDHEEEGGGNGGSLPLPTRPLGEAKVLEEEPANNAAARGTVDVDAKAGGDDEDTDGDGSAEGFAGKIGGVLLCNTLSSSFPSPSPS